MRERSAHSDCRSVQGRLQCGCTRHRRAHRRSYGTEAADEHPDLDLYLVTSDSSYRAFFGDRPASLALLVRAVIAEDFDEFGFDIVVLILDNSVEGEPSVGKAGAFLHIHGGPYRVLLEEVGEATLRHHERSVAFCCAQARARTVFRGVRASLTQPGRTGHFRGASPQRHRVSPGCKPAAWGGSFPAPRRVPCRWMDL